MQVSTPEREPHPQQLRPIGDELDKPQAPEGENPLKSEDIVGESLSPEQLKEALREATDAMDNELDATQVNLQEVAHNINQIHEGGDDLTPIEKTSLKKIWAKMREATTNFLQKVKEVFGINQSTDAPRTPESIISQLDAVAQKIQEGPDLTPEAEAALASQEQQLKMIYQTLTGKSYRKPIEVTDNRHLERPVADTGTKAPVVDNADVPYDINMAAEMDAEAMNKQVELPNLAPPPTTAETPRKPVEATMASKENIEVEQQRALFEDARIQTYDALSQQFLQQLDQLKKIGTVDKEECATLRKQFQSGDPKFRFSPIPEYNNLQATWNKMEALKKSKFIPTEARKPASVPEAQPAPQATAVPEININVGGVYGKEMPRPEDVQKFVAPKAATAAEKPAINTMEGTDALAPVDEAPAFRAGECRISTLLMTGVKDELVSSIHENRVDLRKQIESAANNFYQAVDAHHAGLKNIKNLVENRAKQMWQDAGSPEEPKAKHAERYLQAEKEIQNWLKAETDVLKQKMEEFSQLEVITDKAKQALVESKEIAWEQAAGELETALANNVSKLLDINAIKAETSAKAQSIFEQRSAATTAPSTEAQPPEPQAEATATTEKESPIEVIAEEVDDEADEGAAPEQDVKPAPSAEPGSKPKVAEKQPDKTTEKGKEMKTIVADHVRDGTLLVDPKAKDRINQYADKLEFKIYQGQLQIFIPEQTEKAWAALSVPETIRIIDEAGINRNTLKTIGPESAVEPYKEEKAQAA